MNAFAGYLLGLGLAPSTAATYARTAEELTAWLEDEGLTLEEATYRDLLAWLRTLGGGAKTRALHLTAARHLFAFLVTRRERPDNPLTHVTVRGVRRPLPNGLLSEEELGTLVRDYVVAPTDVWGDAPPARQRNKALLGVLAYQGVGAGELARLEVEDVDLERGRLSVPGSRTSEGRTLALEGAQVLALHRYLVEGRPRLLEASGKMTGRLFVSAGRGHQLNNALSVLMRELRARHAGFRNARQLRSSRIALWLRQHDLREVQYRAGHRFVSSTERYRAADLDALHHALTRHHPLA